MNAEVSRALEQDRTIDITTTGRKTGQLRKTEIWFHSPFPLQHGTDPENVR